MFAERKNYATAGQARNGIEMRLQGAFWRRLDGKAGFLFLFLFCAFPTGMLITLLTPPGQSPDEPAHIERAAGLLHGAVLGVRKPVLDPGLGRVVEQSGVKVDTGIAVAAFGDTTMIGGHPVLTAQDFLAVRAQLPDHRWFFANIPNTVSYFPIAYVPATLGLGVGLLLHLSPHLCFLLARFAMLVAYLALGAAALWFCAFGEALLLTVLLLPMSLFLGATVNEDGVLIGLACLACALLSRGARWQGAVLFALFVSAKAPYIAMLGTFALPLFTPGAARRVAGVALAALPVLFWVALVSAFVLVPYARPEYHPGPLYTGDPGAWFGRVNAAANLHILLARPLRLISLPWHTMLQGGVQNLREMVGVLGPLQIMLPATIYHLWAVCIGAALLGLLFCPRPAPLPAGLAMQRSVLTLALLLLTCWLMLVGFYLDWTDVGEPIIEGMQGRYWIPLLPFLLFVIPGQRRFVVPPIVPAIPALAMGLFDIGYLPAKLVFHYYLH
jgi:hypothetical protein